MIVGMVQKSISKQHIALMLCLIVAVNSVQGTVLCFGADGHIEYESAFHGKCACHDHSGFARGTDSTGTDYDEDKNCDHGPCVDVPVDFDLAQLSPTTEQQDQQFAAADVDIMPAVQTPNFLEYDLASAERSTTSYFTPLRTIVLLA